MSHVVQPMQKPTPPVSLADLSAAGIRLRPYDAVTIVRQLVLQAAHHEVAGVPSAHVIRLSSNGTISVEGPVGAGGPSVGRAAQLLNSLLPSAAEGSHVRVPGGLRIVVARALGNLDLPPFDSLESFADALERFGSTDPSATVRSLVTAWAEVVSRRGRQSDWVDRDSRSPLAQIEQFAAVRPLGMDLTSELTVSDIRRARRATGLTLTHIATQSDVPLTLLRQLEWGYLLHWPSGSLARSLLIRYARAAGLDEELVVATISPLLVEAENRRAALVPRPADIPVRFQGPAGRFEEPVVEVQVLSVAHEPVRAERIPSSKWTKALAAFAIPALLVIALLPAWWASSSRSTDGGSTTPSDTNRAADATPDTSGSVPASSTETEGPEAQPRESPRVAGSQSRRSGIPESAATAGRTEVTDTGQTDSETTERSRLASDGVGDASLRPAGTAMFYSASDAEAGVSGVVPARADSHDAVLRITRIVDDAANNLNLRVAPDGQRIAFDSDRDGVRGVYVADRDGKNVRRVSADGFAAIPSWSPNGRALVFVRADASTSNVWNLWMLQVDTGELTQITRYGSGQPRGASWFPDGNRLAYCYADRLIVRDLRTNAEHVFASPRRNQRLRSAAVSPDGRRIVFHVERDGAWLLELSDGSMRRVLEDPTGEEYTWSPDGGRFAYHSRKSDTWRVWVMAPR